MIRPRPSNPRLVVVAALLAAAACANAQTSPSPVDTLTRTLDALTAQAATLQTALPSFECTEAVTTSFLRDGKEKDVAHFTATIRSQREDTRGSGETYLLKSINGKPVADPNKRIPIYASGGFDRVLHHFAAAERACYTFSLSPARVSDNLRVDFQTVPQVDSMAQCSRSVGLQGFALVDREGNATHIERTLPIAYAQQFHITPFAASDLSPVTLNGRTYLLSSHIVATWPQGNGTERFEATYSACHRFSSTVTLMPGTSVVNDDQATTPK